MKYIPCDPTPRIALLREEYKATPVARERNSYVEKRYKKFTTADRWITMGFLEGWLKHERAPTARRRRSIAEAEELYAAKPVILPHELLVGQPYLPELDEEEYSRYTELCEMFRMSSIPRLELGPRVDHLSLDLEKLLRVGVNGLLAEIDEKMSALDLADPDIYPGLEAMEKFDFYECCRIELKALLDLASRYAAYAREQAEAAEAVRRKELLEIAKTLDNVPANPARTFREALQSAQFFLGTLFGLYPLNRPDRYLIEYYERDLASGIITQGEAQELIDNFCLSITARVFSRAACGFIVGGIDKNGELTENALTYMFLTALEHVRMPDPNGALAVCKETSDDILRYSVEIISKGVTHPAFYNDRAIRESLIKYGCLPEDACDYIHTTCAEISVAGRTRSHTTPLRAPLPALLREAVKALPDDADFDTLRDAFIKRTRKHLEDTAFGYVMRMLEAKRNGHEPMRVCTLVTDCISRGKTIWEGGERYSFMQPIFVGFANAVDSLVAIKRLVYEEGRLTLSEFSRIVEENFEGNEPLRRAIIHRLPHYGNDECEPDSIAEWLSGRIKTIFRDKPFLAGNMMMPGTFSYVDHAECGKHDLASFDGRLAHTSYSDGCSPVQGRDTHGPTAMVLSLTGWDQSEFLGGMVVNVKFSPEHLTPRHADSFIDLLRAFIERGGLEMQVNVVSRETLREAQDDPASHEDLIVRIGGYSDYFVRLPKVLQDEIIARSEL